MMGLYEYNWLSLKEVQNIHANIKYLKRLSGLTYNELSTELGFTKNVVRNWVNNGSRPNYDRLMVLCKYFGINDIKDITMPEREFKIKYQQTKKDLV